MQSKQAFNCLVLLCKNLCLFSFNCKCKSVTLKHPLKYSLDTAKKAHQWNRTFSFLFFLMLCLWKNKKTRSFRNPKKQNSNPFNLAEKQWSGMSLQSSYAITLRDRTWCAGEWRCELWVLLNRKTGTGVTYPFCQEFRKLTVCR